MAKVSVCIPTYNRVDYLQYAVNSVLAQHYDDFEIIICDDASTDGTPAMIAQWQDPRICYLRHPQNIGRSRNMRSGFEAASGQYFIKFDDDDALTPDFLAKTVAILDAEPTIDFVCTNHWIIDQQGTQMESATQENVKRWGKDRLKRGKIPNLLRQTFDYQSLQVGSTLFRHQSLQAVDYMRPQADGCEDYDLLVRLAIAGQQGYFLPELLMEYRLHSGQTSLQQNLHFLQAKTDCIASYHFDDVELEQTRCQKLAQTQQALGLRLIESGAIQEGRRYLQQATQQIGASRNVQLGWLLSYCPGLLRQLAFAGFRRLRPKDYSEKVRRQA